MIRNPFRRRPTEFVVHIGGSAWRFPTKTKAVEFIDRFAPEERPEIREVRA